MKTFSTILITLASAVSLYGQTSSQNYTINPQVIDNGGGASSSANYAITRSSLGGIFGVGSSSNYENTSGYIAQLTAIDQMLGAIDLTDYDSWITQFPGIVSTDRGADPDGDGFTNEEEFYALTDPTDPSARITLDIIRPDDTTALIDFDPRADASLRTYTLLGSDDLISVFTPVGDTSLNLQRFTHSSATPERFFYKIRITIP